MYLYELLTLIDTLVPNFTPNIAVDSINNTNRDILTLTTPSHYIYLKDYLIMNILQFSSLEIFEYQTFIKHGLVFQTDTTPVL